jgi:hypothetical protein
MSGLTLPEFYSQVHLPHQHSFNGIKTEAVGRQFARTI